MGSRRRLTKEPGRPSEPHAARYLDPLRVDPVVLAGEQRCDHAADVIWLASATQGGHTGDRFVDGRVVPHYPAAEVRCDSPWCDSVHSDNSGTQGGGQVASEDLDRALESRIRGAVLVDEPYDSGGNVDDLPAVVDERKQPLRQQQDALEVDRVEPVELLLGQLGERGVARDAAVVDEVVEAIHSEIRQGGSHLIHESVEAADVPGIKLQSHRPGAD